MPILLKRSCGRRISIAIYDEPPKGVRFGCTLRGFLSYEVCGYGWIKRNATIPSKMATKPMTRSIRLATVWMWERDLST